MKEALDKLFTNHVEQIRVADLERELKRKPTDDELWSYHNAGVFKYNYSLIYDYNRKAKPPIEITTRAPSDLEVAARIVKSKRVKKSKSIVGRNKATELAKRNGIDTTRYNHLDNGRLAMVINNLLRGREKRGEAVIW